MTDSFRVIWQTVGRWQRVWLIAFAIWLLALTCLATPAVWPGSIGYGEHLLGLGLAVYVVIPGVLFPLGSIYVAYKAVRWWIVDLLQLPDERAAKMPRASMLKGTQQNGDRRPGTVNAAYALYLVIGVGTLYLLGFLASFTSQGAETTAWLTIAGFMWLTIFFVPIAIVCTIIRLFAGIEWKLLFLLIATVVTIGIPLFSLLSPVASSAVGDAWEPFMDYVLSLWLICYSLVAVTLSGWHFIMRRKSMSDP